MAVKHSTPSKDNPEPMNEGNHEENNARREQIYFVTHGLYSLLSISLMVASDQVIGYPVNESYLPRCVFKVEDFGKLDSKFNS